MNLDHLLSFRCHPGLQLQVMLLSSQALKERLDLVYLLNDFYFLKGLREANRMQRDPISFGYQLSLAILLTRNYYEYQSLLMVAESIIKRDYPGQN